MSTEVPPGTLTTGRSWLNQIAVSPATIALLLAVAIGVGTGLLLVVFRSAITWIEQFWLYGVAPQWGKYPAWVVALGPIAGGVGVGLLRWWVPDFGQGLSGLKTAVQNAQEISLIKPVAKAIAAIISLGTGASLGPEGPSVEIGANVGGGLGQLLRVSQERQELLLAAGAAAGVAGGFDAPIAGVFFAFEVALGKSLATSAASVILLASVLSSLVVQIGLGGHPAFSLPRYQVLSPLEFPLYLGLGLFASVIAWAYTGLNRWISRLFRGELTYLVWVGWLPGWLQPVVGGAIVGAMALKLPEILGIGYDTIEAVLRDMPFPLTILGLLLGAKLLAAAVSLGSGLVGGVFAPALFMGAMAGAAYGQVLPQVLPWFASSIAAPPAYAMVGMAALLAVMARAPLTAILLLFELTRDYRIVLPLMAAVGISIWLFELWFEPADAPIETVAAEVVLEADADQLRALRRRLTVGEAMQTEYLQFASVLPVTQVGVALTYGQQHGAVVVDATGQMVGIVTLRDINRTVSRWQQATGAPLPTLVGEICSANVVTVCPDDSLAEALDRMALRGLHQLPVVDRPTSLCVVGLLTREAIELACRFRLTREALQPYLLSPDLSSLDLSSSDLPEAE